MAGLDRDIDPVTGDYIDDGAGGTEKVRHAMPAIYHQMKTPKGQWWGDRAAGSRLHELDRAKSSQRTPAVVADMLAEGLAPLVSEGRISEPETVVERSLDRIFHETTSRDLQTGEELDLTPILAVEI